MNLRPTKKSNQHKNKILFVKEEEIEAILNARLGAGNAAIRHATGLSDNQITYRLTKWNKQWLHLEKGITERQQWRSGTSPYFQSMREAMRRDVVLEGREASKQLEKPEAQFVKHEAA
jgi:hypothetical protein